MPVLTLLTLLFMWFIKKNRPRKKSGATFLELLLLLFIMTVILGGASMSLSYFLDRNYLNNHSEQIVHLLRKAQSNARMNLKNSDWGVKINHPDGEHFQYIFFKGETFGADSEYDDVYTLPRSLEIRNVSLEGGGNEIIFSKNTGETPHFGSFDILNINHPDSVFTLSINALGSVQIDR